MKIYIALSDFDKNEVKKLESIADSVTVRGDGPRPSEGELCQLVEEYDVLIIGIREIMSSKVYACVKKLKVLGTLSIGTDHIHQSFFSDENISVINCPDSNVVSVAEHTFALMLSIYKNILEHHSAIIKSQAPINKSRDLYQKKLGVIGAGKIARKVMEIARAFEMEIVCHTFNPDKHDDLVNKGTTFVSLDKLFQESHIITIHLPLTSRSRKLINKSLLQQMRFDTVLINTSRMQIVDNQFLYQMLKDKKILGAAIDGDLEASDINAATSLSNLLVTPHTAGTSIDANARIDTDMTNSIYNLRSAADTKTKTVSS